MYNVDMNRVAQFEKVSLDRYQLDLQTNSSFNIEMIKGIYDGICLPKRATKASAGYDFYLPYDVTIPYGSSIKIISGIRVKMENDYVLQLYPRSSLGFKYRIGLDNTVGIIDADYYNSSNEGHIIIKLSNHSNDHQDVTLKAGSAFCQGIFLQYGITYDDEVSEIRDGGFGSTDKG